MIITVLGRFLVNARILWLGFEELVLLFATMLKSELGMLSEECTRTFYADAMDGGMGGAAYLLQSMKCKFGHKTQKHMSIFVLWWAVKVELCTY